MTTPEMLSLLEDIISKVGLEMHGPLTLETDLRRDLGVDSIDLLDILFELNARLGIAIAIEQLSARSDATRVATMVDCIREERAKPCTMTADGARS